MVVEAAEKRGARVVGVTGGVAAGKSTLAAEGLHLGHPGLAVRDRIDLLVHIDAADDDLARWYLARFQGLRDAAADDPEAFLHRFRDLPGEVMDQMAMDVWSAVNLVVLE